MPWVLIKDPKYWPRIPKIPKIPSIKPIKPIAPLGYKYVWREPK